MGWLRVRAADAEPLDEPLSRCIGDGDPCRPRLNDRCFPPCKGIALSSCSPHSHDYSFLPGGANLVIVIPLRERRNRQGLSQQELARLAGVSQSAISYVERGVRSPTVLFLELIAHGLGVSVHELLREEGNL